MIIVKILVWQYIQSNPWLNQKSIMFPILLLVTAISSIVIYLRTNNDIFGLLGVGMSVSCLIWGLVLAHWSIHILALLALFFVGKPLAIAKVIDNG